MHGIVGLALIVKVMRIVVEWVAIYPDCAGIEVFRLAVVKMLDFPFARLIIGRFRWGIRELCRVASIPCWFPTWAVF
jgi:hypothetical protein